jgi:hypothetical protein
MAWRIAKYIAKGELDNRQQGLVTGTLWLAGRADPVRLELRGNCLRDLAGRLVRFENPSAQPMESFVLDALHVGFTGDMTASRRVKVINLPSPNDKDPVEPAAEPPARTVNKLFLEWFSETNGRIVIEATDFHLSISPASWTMTADEESHQLAANRDSFRHWLEHLSELESAEEIPMPSADSRPMNEFEWEKIFKESDIKNERLSEVLEKYHGHPDSEMLIAREMGWMWVEEELEAQERGVFAEIEEDDADFEEDDEDDDFLAEEQREPNPLREGIDWVRDDDGTIEHPLALKALRFSADLWKTFDEDGKLAEGGDSRIFEWVGLVETAGVRLSNTLGDVAYGDDVEHGYVVAGLKRSVHLIHQALDMLQVIEQQHLLTSEAARNAQKQLFDLREEIIALMNAHRRDG